MKVKYKVLFTDTGNCPIAEFDIEATCLCHALQRAAAMTPDEEANAHIYSYTEQTPKEVFNAS